MGTTEPGVLIADRYERGELLGRGGMSDVHAGFDRRLERPVAIKTLHAHMAARPDIRTRFELEARAAARLSHPNAVAVFDVGEDDGMPYIVMERLPGETLADRIAAGPVDPGWLRRAAGDVLGALAAAHASGIVHRDVKPGNILIGTDGCAKIADFGIAKSMQDATGGLDVTATGQLIGTPAYLAPERLEGAPATPESDIYSLGVVLYEALAGAKPFAGETPIATARAIAAGDHAPLSRRCPALDPRLTGAVERAMAREPARRFASAAAMADALGVDLAGARPPRPTDPTVAGPAVAAVASNRVDEVATPTRVNPMGPMPVVGPGTGWRRWVATGRRTALLVVLAAFVLLFVVLAVAIGGGGSGADPAAKLASQLRQDAGRLTTSDGTAAPQLAARLRSVADEVAAGQGGPDATALFRDVARWSDAGQLSGPAAATTMTLLRGVPGFDGAAATPTTAPPPPPTTVPPKAREDKKGEHHH